MTSIACKRIDSPFVFGGIIPLVFASQLALAVLALLACRISAPSYHVFVVAAMIAQLGWRGLSNVIGT